MNRTAVGDNIRALALALIALFLLTSVGVGRRMLLSPELANDPQDPRVAAVVFDRARGPVLARDGTVLAQGRPRQYAEPSLAQVVGYASAAYGAAGIELAYGAALVGQDSTDPLAVLRVRFLGARAPPGSVTLGIDPATQRAAAAVLAGRTGAGGIGERAGVERGQAHRCEDLAGARVERDDRAGAPGERSGRRTLRREIDAERHRPR